MVRLILFDQPTATRRNFDPLALNRPIFELRSGMTTLGEKVERRFPACEVAYFVPPYTAGSLRQRTDRSVNQPASLAGDGLLLVNARAKSDSLPTATDGPSEVALDANGEVLYARIAERDLRRLSEAAAGPSRGIEDSAAASDGWPNSDAAATLLDGLLEAAKRLLPPAAKTPETWNYLWDLVLANPQQLTDDFAAARLSGIDGIVEEPFAIRGSKRDIFIGHGTIVHPMVVIDASRGPVFIDEGAEIQPFTRVEGPCYVGKNSILLGCKCREGNSIGPMCRVGGEIEESIVQGYSNKYHDGFLGHAYVGEWVNLGAMTTNSDLKNDYSSVAVSLDGKKRINTGSTKVGSLIGDHTKTSIGTLLNTGAYIGAMTLLVANGGPLPKFLPSFTWYLDGRISEGFGKPRFYHTARAAMARRGKTWTEIDEALWDAVYEMTAQQREVAG